MNFKKIIPTICAIAVVWNLSSCNNEDDKIPCTNEELSAFKFLLLDEEENMILENEEFDIDGLTLVAISDEEDLELAFELKKTSEDIPFISSMEMSELSIEEGISTFELRLNEEVMASFSYSVSSSNTTSGCLTFSYEAKSDDESLETISSGNITTYVLIVNPSEEGDA
ncbi:MAG: hypothetical protein ACXIUQ_12630 [Cecembia sp.]